MRTTVIQAISGLVREGWPVHLLTGDLGFGLMKDFIANHPEHFTNVGVAEANMIGVAAGMAASGLRPFCYSMVPFVFMRAFEQVRMDLCVNNFPVVLIGVGGGLSYGFEGPSHFAIEDLAMARSIPNLRTIAPGDPWEAKAAVDLAFKSDGPTFIRLGRNNDPSVHEGLPKDLSKSSVLLDKGSDLLIICSGHILYNTWQAAKSLADKGLPVRLLSAPLIKPFDKSTVSEMAASAKLVVTVEEHSHIGGLGSEVAEILFQMGFQGGFMKVALPDEFPETVGDHDYLREVYGLSPTSIAKIIEEKFTEK